MQHQTRLDRLQDRVAASLRQLPGATALYLFGSRGTGQADQYSDLDLQVLTADMTAARAVWPHFLEHIGPIEVAWPLSPAAENTAFAILFRGESYYHKLDIALRDTHESATLATPPHVQLWSQPPATFQPAPPATEAYIPLPEAVGHLVIDELIASVRYIKARKRGQELTCWRFLRVKPDRLLHLIAQRAQAWSPREQPLTTWDYKALDGAIDAAERRHLVQHLNWSEPRMMDRSCYWLTQQIIQLAQQKALAQDEFLPAQIIDRHLAFVRAELDLGA